MPDGTRMPITRRSGFTLIELLIAMLVIAILAALALPRFRNTKGKTYYAAVRSDLQNLSTAEEAFFAQYHRYTTDLDSLNISNSPGVVLTVAEASPTGWSATAYHQQSYPRTCAVFFGNVAALAPATDAGQVTCD